MSYPPNFYFGASTAAFQIEGAYNEDGKGASVWDHFTNKRFKIKNRDNAKVACDHYHRYQEDVKLMHHLGHNAYRFSIAWSRVMPEGEGQLNQKGLDFYSRLIDQLLAHDLEPFATLFHWDLPLALQKKYGGFASRETSYRFADYAQEMAHKFGDRVKYYTTLNEPSMYATLGNLLGVHAPGRRNPWAWLKTVHHLLLAHGLAAKAIRAIQDDAKVGCTLQLVCIHPARINDKDIVAANIAKQFLNELYLDPLYGKGYPKDLEHRLRFFWPTIDDGDMAIIAQPLDFLGINHYTRIRASYKWYVPFLKLLTDGTTIPKHEFVKDNVQHTAFGWQVYPEGLYEVLNNVHEKYNAPKLFITENGAAYTDTVVDGKVDDVLRTKYFQDYLSQVERAINNGIDIQGYFAWSLLDNFEWGEGYSKRFGIVHVDYETQKRTVKDSGYWLRQYFKEKLSS